MSDFKLKLSKPTFDAITETDPNNLVFSSDYNTFKYAASGTITFHINAGGASDTEYTLTHSFGYKPVAMASYTDSTLSKYYPLAFYDSSTGFYVAMYITSTQLIFRVVVFGSTVARDVTIAYKVFKNDTGL